MKKYKDEHIKEVLKQLDNKVAAKFNENLTFEERQFRIIGYKQAIKDIAASLEIAL